MSAHPTTVAVNTLVIILLDHTTVAVDQTILFTVMEGHVRSNVHPLVKYIYS